MPVLPSTLSTDILLDRSVSITNISSEALKVVCVWPVSGQYGPGTRFLYYALISACILGREVEWLRTACLAAALLFPAVAALHGIVLAAVHVDGAVDMDLYGAFQVCSIGILLAPVTLMLSRSYFAQAGSSIIILWTALILAGLVSLTVEFFRAKTSHCAHDVSGEPIPTSPRDFPYGATCGLVCNVTSPMRMGSANNIYVIPAPDKLTFNAGTLLSAACCIPAILLLIINWNKIRETNLKERLFRDNQHASAPEGAEPDNTNNQSTGNGCEAEETSDKGTRNGQGEEQTDVCVCNDNEVEHSGNRRTRNVVTTPIFGAAILSILAIGEWNFFSPQVQYQTEPMASIGQWAPIVGTGFALLGSLYVLLAKDIVLAKREVEQEKRDAEEEKKENHHHHQQQQHQKTVASTEHDDGPGPSVHVSPQPTSADNATCERCGRALKSSNPSSEEMSRSHRILAVLAGWRRRGSRRMIKVADFIGTAAEGTFENKAFKSAKAKWILYPGEEKKNPALIDEEAHWDARVRSREFSRSSEVSPSRSGSMEPQSRNSIPASSSTSQTEHRHSEATVPRSDTLQLPFPPSPVHRAPIKESSPPVSPTEVIIPGGQNNPALVVNDDGQLSRSETHPTPPAPAFRLWPFSSRRGTV